MSGKRNFRTLLKALLAGMRAIPRLACDRLVRDLKEMNETLFRWPSPSFRSWYYVVGGCLCGWLLLRSLDSADSALATASAPVGGIILSAIGYLLIAFLYKVATTIRLCFLAIRRWVPLFLTAVASAFLAVVAAVRQVPKWWRSVRSRWSQLTGDQKRQAMGKIAFFCLFLGAWSGLNWFMWPRMAPLCQYADWLFTGGATEQFLAHIIVSSYCSLFAILLAFPLCTLCVQLCRMLRRRISS